MVRQGGIYHEILEEAAGMKADLIVMEGNPLDDPRALRRRHGERLDGLCGAQQDVIGHVGLGESGGDGRLADVAEARVGASAGGKDDEGRSCCGDGRDNAPTGHRDCFRTASDH